MASDPVHPPSAADLARQLHARFPEWTAEPVEFRGEFTVALGDAAKVRDVCLYAKQELGFDYLVDVSSVDQYDEDPRFTLVYHLYSYQHAAALRLKTNVGEEPSELPSVTAVWRGAEWHEREIYDLMGIRFREHPDLRRILMWEDYPYFPLRKDFPLGGKPSQAPEVAFSEKAPLEGGPFVTSPGTQEASEREPRARIPEDQTG